MKVKVYEFTDNKTSEIFKGSYEDYCKHFNIAASTLSSRVYYRRVTKKLIDYKDNGKTREVDKRSDSKTKRELNKYYLTKAWQMLNN